VDAITLTLLAVLLIAGGLATGGIFAEHLAAFLRRLRPGFEYDHARVLLKGLLLLVSFVLGLLVMYLALTTPWGGV
jgi:hypothetical protein